MKENVLDVLIYLFENYMFDNDDFGTDHETLLLELSQAGFDQTMIDNAFAWLENLTDLCDSNSCLASIKQGTIRHYSAEELREISVEARGLLLTLEQCGVLDGVSREMVIDRLMALGVDSIELAHLKWVILLVLSNYTDGDGVTELTETLILDGLHTCIH